MKLKEWLIKNNIKMTNFAKKINYSKGNLSRIINGKLTPSYKIAFLIEKETNGEVAMSNYGLNEKSKNYVKSI